MFQKIKNWLFLQLLRLFYGGRGSITWNFDFEFFKFVCPNLKKFREVAITYPPDTTPEQWHAELDNAIEQLEFIVTNYFTDDMEVEIRVYSTKQAFLNWWAKRCLALWW